MTGMYRRMETALIFVGAQPVLQPAGDRRFLLNPVTWEIWERLDYAITPEGLVAGLMVEFDVDAATCQAAVDDTIAALLAAGLLAEVDPASVDPARDAYFRLLKKSLGGFFEIENTMRMEHLVHRSGPLDRALREDLLGLRYTRPDQYDELVRLRRVGGFRLRAFTEHLGEGSFSASMVGLQRLTNIERLAETIFAERVPGDFLEAGVCRGGCTILMRALQRHFGEAARAVWLADSFEGVPPSTAPEDVAGRVDLSRARYPELVAGVDVVLDNFRAYDLLDANVHVLPGLFADSLPGAPVGPLALLRVDADLYGSTMDVLENLYDRVSPGGFVIVDDYGAIEVCRRAVDTFRTLRCAGTELHRIDHSGVWWRKPA